MAIGGRFKLFEHFRAQSEEIGRRVLLGARQGLSPARGVGHIRTVKWLTILNVTDRAPQ